MEKQEIINRLTEKQKQDLGCHNKNRQVPKTYLTGETIFVKVNKRLGSKLTPKYKKETVNEDRNTTVLTTSGRIVYKSNIKR